MRPHTWSLLFLVGLTGVSHVSTKRIVGGDPTTIERYPSIVQVEHWDPFIRAWVQSCAANVISNVYILTAAHCFAGLLYRHDWRRIRAGTTFRESGGVVLDVAYEINHPSYGRLQADGDISVVRLTSALTYSAAIQRIGIPPQGTLLPDHLPVVYAGWGHTQHSGDPSDVLRDVTVFTINRQLCADRYIELPDKLVVTENMICTGILDVGGKDACQGDSGGPMYYGDVLVGIVSWGEGCANKTYPGVSTAVSSYTNWIVSTAV